jgi:hypothetical protein
MSYKSDPSGGRTRDGASASEIASLRPIGATRTHCRYEDEGERDGTHTPEDAVARFNRELRGGHAGRNDGER